MQPISIPGLGPSSCSEVTIWSPCSQTKLVNWNKLIWKYLKIMKCQLKYKFLSPFEKSQVVATLYPHCYGLSHGCPLQIKDTLSSSPQFTPFPIVSHTTPAPLFPLAPGPCRSWGLWLLPDTPSSVPTVHGAWIQPHVSTFPQGQVLSEIGLKQLYPYHNISTRSPVPGHLWHPKDSGFHRSWCDSCPY